MSHLASGESRTQGIDTNYLPVIRSLLQSELDIKKVSDAPRAPVKCRIPQRLPPGRRSPAAARNKAANPTVSESAKSKLETTVTAQQNGRCGGPTTTVRPRSTESRPKSANRKDDQCSSTKQLFGRQQGLRQPVQERERFFSAPKRPCTIPKKLMESFIVPNPQKLNRPVIVPLTQVTGPRIQHKVQDLPDQETIKKCEDLEIQRELSDMNEILNDINDRESLTSKSEIMTQLKLTWHENMNVFEKMKIELNSRQKTLIQLYAKMRETQQKMSAMGQKLNMPSAEDLRIMNVTKMSPNQLLQLCADSSKLLENNNPLISINFNKLYNMPNNLVSTCEQTLVKRKEIIDWFESLKKEEKGISMSKLSKKINEFNAENEMLNCSLQNVKADFIKELSEIVEYLRKSVNDTVAFQLRAEELNYELSELNSQNADLRKLIQNADFYKSTNLRHKIEELEKELKEEKCKKLLMRDRLTRAEGQVKIGAERSAQLEAALEQVRSQNWTLDRTVQQLQEQNQKLQSDFDRELYELTESIRENTVHLEEIAEAREKLQTEKENLEKRLNELSEHYNESLQHVKEELKVNVAKILETEKKFDQEKEERNELEIKLESLCAQLLESELRYKDVIKELQEKESQLNKAMSYQSELEESKRGLSLANMEIEDYRKGWVKQNDNIREIERDFKEAINLEVKLKHDLRIKEEYVTELEKKQTLLEQQLKESECKMESYEEQLTALKNHIGELQEDFGEFENIHELHEMISQQRAKLLEATRQNGELAEALQNKDSEMERHIESLTQQEQILEQKDGVIKMLSEKEEEQSKIIKLLRNNVEMRAKADKEISQQLSEKNALVETRMLQISQLEKIILTLEDQLREVNFHRKKDQEKITSLEKIVSEYEHYKMDCKRSIDGPAENLDNLIKILEDELGNSFDSQLLSLREPKKYNERATKRDKVKYHEGDTSPTCTEHEKMPTKIVMGNFVKKTYISTSDDQYKGDNLDRKKAITNIDSHKWTPANEPGINLYAPSPPMKDNCQAFKGTLPRPSTKDQHFTRNLQFLMSNQQKEEKKYKMFKLAGHKL